MDNPEFDFALFRKLGREALIENLYKRVSSGENTRRNLNHKRESDGHDYQSNKNS